MVPHLDRNFIEQVNRMAASIDEQILRATKEIIVKFIEVGRVSPTSFDESFRTVYQTIHDSVKQNQKKTPET
jgi:hypothetical protein